MCPYTRLTVQQLHRLPLTTAKLQTKASTSQASSSLRTTGYAQQMPSQSPQQDFLYTLILLKSEGCLNFIILECIMGSYRIEVWEKFEG